MATSTLLPRPDSALRARNWLLAALGANLVVVLALFTGGVNTATLGQPGQLLQALGRLAGLLGALALAGQLLLIARIPALDRRLGMARLAAWHRIAGISVCWLLITHLTFITLGYAAQDGSPAVTELDVLVFGTQDVLKAVVALGLIALVAVTSARRARRRLSYERWHFVHLYAYLAVVLAFAHQVTIGHDFVGSAVARGYWWTLWGVALGSVLVARVLIPLWHNVRHRLRVADVVVEGPDAVSIYLTGRRLAVFSGRAGQYCLWRFLTRDRWWEAHPYSFSALPNDRCLRITVKALGDGSAALRTLRPGTRVLAEGPYGAFTSDRASQPGVVLIGGGVGITPIRAILEEIPDRAGNVTVIYRVNTPAEAALLPELRELAMARHATLFLLPGPIDASTPHGPALGPAHLAELAPDIPQRDVFVCGPPGMTRHVQRSLRALHVPESQVHTELFGFPD